MARLTGLAFVSIGAVHAHSLMGPADIRGIKSGEYHNGLGYGSSISGSPVGLPGGSGRIGHQALPLGKIEPIDHPVLSLSRGAPYKQTGAPAPLVLMSNSVSNGARGAQYQSPDKARNLVSIATSLLKDETPVVLSKSNVPLDVLVHSYSGRLAHGALDVGQRATEKEHAEVTSAGAQGGARGLPAQGMDNYYTNVHLYKQKEDLVKVGSLNGSPVAGDSGRSAHNDNGVEINYDGSTQSTYLRGGNSDEDLPLFEKMKFALGLSQIPTAQPTPAQPLYLNDKGPLYAPRQEPSMFTNFLNKIKGNVQETDISRPYMDGLSKPDWSFGQKL